MVCPSCVVVGKFGLWTALLGTGPIIEISLSYVHLTSEKFLKCRTESDDKGKTKTISDFHLGKHCKMTVAFSVMEISWNFYVL